MYTPQKNLRFAQRKREANMASCQITWVKSKSSNLQNLLWFNYFLNGKKGWLNKLIDFIQLKKYFGQKENHTIEQHVSFIHNIILIS